MENVKISVILSAYNEEERWFRKAVESILNQSFKEFELILILDNPNNELLDKIIKEYKEKDSRIIYIKNEKNLGLVESLNRGIKASSGLYIARMDADDIAYIDRLEKQYEFMEENKDIALIGTSVDFIDEDDNIIQSKTKVVKNSVKIIEYLKHTNVVVHPTFFFRREILDKVKGYREVSFAEDYDFICRVAASGYKITNLEEPLLRYRIRQNSISRDKTLAQIYNAFYLKKLYKERLKTGMDSYNIEDLYSDGKIDKKEIENFTKSEKLKLKAESKRKEDKLLESKMIFIYSKLISKYARKNTIATIKYRLFSKLYK